MYSISTSTNTTPAPRIDLRRYLRFALLCGALVLYSFIKNLTCSELLFLLAPTSWLVSCITGISFSFDSTEGFVSEASRIIIAPSCAGARYLGISLMMGLVVLPARFLTVWILLLLTIFSLATTILANTMRIVTVISLERILLAQNVSVPSWFHEACGSFVYMAALSLTYFFMRSYYDKKIIYERNDESTTSH
jgi:exosortase K